MINFYVKTPQAKRSAIGMSVWARGKRYRLSTGVVNVKVSDWNKKTQRIRQSSNNLASAVEDNEALDLIQAAATRTVAKFKTRRNPPSLEEFRAAFDIEYRGEPEPKTPKIPHFTNYMKSYIERYQATKSYNTTRAITTIYNKLCEYEKQRRKKMTFDAINMTLYVELSTYFAKQGYRESYFATAIKVIKQVFREARDVDKIHSFDGIDSKGFTSSAGEVDNIYLCEEELALIHQFEVTLEMLRSHYPDSRESDLLRKVESLRTARAYFLIGAYTGLRVSDFTRLGSADISDRIRIKTLKTAKNVVIPIHPIVREILNSDLDLTKPPSAQRLNDSLKELAKLAGINGTVQISRRIGGQTITESRERWNLVTNHTARRSFATNAYKAGVPTLSIMRITGHTKEANFLKYIKMGNEENAEALEQHPFFKGS